MSKEDREHITAALTSVDGRCWGSGVLGASAQALVVEPGFAIEVWLLDAAERRVS